ncbi:MAG: hypothetical protein ACREDZ_06050 [Kiloniellales bacterium]
MLTDALGALDGLMGGLPDALRLVVWALLCAGTSMGLYNLFSPQRSLRQIACRRRAVQRRLNRFEGSLSEAGPLLGEQLRLALRQLALVLLPTALAIAPVLLVILWLDVSYGYRFPEPDEPPVVNTEPPQQNARLLPPGEGADSSSDRTEWALQIDFDGSEPLWLPIKVPVPVIGKARWWNALFDNPAGYLPPKASIDTAELALPMREYLAVGPQWLRPWYVLFLAVMTLASLGIKFGFRII